MTLNVPKQVRFFWLSWNLFCLHTHYNRQDHRKGPLVGARRPSFLVVVPSSFVLEVAVGSIVPTTCRSWTTSTTSIMISNHHEDVLAIFALLWLEIALHSPKAPYACQCGIPLYTKRTQACRATTTMINLLVLGNRTNQGTRNDSWYHGGDAYEQLFLQDHLRL